MSTDAPETDPPCRLADETCDGKVHAHILGDDKPLDYLCTKHGRAEYGLNHAKAMHIGGHP